MEPSNPKSSHAMPVPEPGSGSRGNSSSPYDLNLPEVREGEGPLPLKNPTYEEQMAHARFLLSLQPPDFWEKRRARMNQEPFRWEEEER